MFMQMTTGYQRTFPRHLYLQNRESTNRSVPSINYRMKKTNSDLYSKIYGHVRYVGFPILKIKFIVDFELIVSLRMTGTATARAPRKGTRK